MAFCVPYQSVSLPCSYFPKSSSKVCFPKNLSYHKWFQETIPATPQVVGFSERVFFVGRMPSKKSLLEFYNRNRSRPLENTPKKLLEVWPCYLSRKWNFLIINISALDQPEYFQKRIEPFHSNNTGTHPVLSIIQKRKLDASLPGKRNDPFRVALCIEGGGMRGSIAAGMTAAIKYLNLENVFDVVYGSSAGAIIGAYFVSRQLPLYGTSVYYEDLCSRDFIRKRQLFYRYLQPNSKHIPVLDLDSLIDEVIVYSKPLDWNAFWKNCQVQPLKPVATSLRTLEAKVLDNYKTFEELRQCLRASALVPGIAGEPVSIDGDIFADAILHEAIPLRSALREGATHVLVLRTRPQGARIPHKAGMYERLIAVPSFRSQQNFPAIQAFVLSGRHRQIYYEDIERLKRAKTEFGATPPYLYDLAVPRFKRQVGQLESRQEVIFKAVRDGFAVAYQELTGVSIEDSERVASSIYTEEEFLRLKKQREMMRFRRENWKRRLRSISLFKPKTVLKKRNSTVSISSFLDNESLTE
ncbi:hypothetical protein GpartN1_g2175.t1 [Galdieria partita]|uniref:PNPLA domain-containing protein n=1 Tax=Galdieria partita TaxID=83374 RepID=A0A9C7PUE2_9RHOD|nr:hypothetical protein GpartN1_g2175.t1 [Galdieria partita]